MKTRGKAHKFGDNINTDEIIPAMYLNTTDAAELGAHCMDGIVKDFAAKMAAQDIIVAGSNFGCGSSREHAPLAIKACGISCVIAKSFARIFYRNAINIGLPILETGEAADTIKEGDLLEIDYKQGMIKDITQKKTFTTQSFSPFMRELIECGGLMEWIKKRGQDV